jgi:UDP-GlcNAc:undecaprenyl-phosphate GlcNAc-1-phosphate transferase
MFIRSRQQTALAVLSTATNGSVHATDQRSQVRIGEWALAAIQVAVPLYLIVSVAMPREIPWDAGMIAAGLLIALLGSMAAGRGTPWAVRLGLYVGSTCLMYYSESSPRLSGSEIMTPVNIGFVILAGLVVLTIRFAGEDRFQTTPLDYLIVLLAVVMPFLPDMTAGDVPVSLLAAKLIVLFFSFELLLHIYAAATTRLGWVSAWMLGGLVLRAWW